MTVAPRAATLARRSGFGSEMRTSTTPCARRAYHVPMPIGPAPRMRAVVLAGGAGPAHTVPGHGHGFDESGMLETDRCGHRVELGGADGHRLGHAAAVRIRAQGRHESAARRFPVSAGDAFAAAVGDGEDRTPIAHGDAVDAGTHLGDGAGELVAEGLGEVRAGDRVRGEEVDGGGLGVGVEVEVAAADADEAVAQPDLTGARGGRCGDVLDSKILASVESHCLHRSSSPAGVMPGPAWCAVCRPR